MILKFAERKRFTAGSQRRKGRWCPDYDGLLIQPCIPRYWKEYRVVRRFRGAKYQIMVKNPDGQHEGVVSLTVDGKTVKGNKVPLFEDGFHTVIAQLGRYEDNSNVLSGR